jgi:hypothetical protein
MDKLGIEKDEAHENKTNETPLHKVHYFNIFYVMLKALNASYFIFVFQYTFINASENQQHR